MAEKQIIPAIVGLSGGFVIAGGVIALMVGLGIITRFVGITHTAKHVKGYETAILAGAIFGNLLTAIIMPKQKILIFLNLPKRLSRAV